MLAWAASPAHAAWPSIAPQASALQPENTTEDAVQIADYWMGGGAPLGLPAGALASIMQEPNDQDGAASTQGQTPQTTVQRQRQKNETKKASLAWLNGGEALGISTPSLASAVSLLGAATYAQEDAEAEDESVGPEDVKEDALGLSEGEVSTAALTLQQQRRNDSTCAGHFFLYVDQAAYNETWHADRVLTKVVRAPIHLVDLCKMQSGFCQPLFLERLRNHPCRTRTLTKETPIAVANPLHRAINRSWSDEVLIRMFHRGFESSYRMLQNLPQYVRSHPHVYLFESGEHQNMRGYDVVKPPQAITFGTGDPMWATHTSRMYYEPKVPNTTTACYLYKPNDQYVSMPYYEPYSQDGKEKEPPFEYYAAARKNTKRPIDVFYYAGIHGMGVNLRSRLYTVCDAAQKTGNINWACPRKPLPRAEGFRMVAKSKFCLIPVGDAPGRVFMFQVLQRGCIPVLFSSCTESLILQSHTHLLPADPVGEIAQAAESRSEHWWGQKLFSESSETGQTGSSATFGKRKWSMLLNQTAVMTSETYMIDALNSITEDEVAEMRGTITDTVARRITYSPRARDDDALAFAINHMLHKGRGMPTNGPTIPADFKLWYPPQDET